MAADPLDPRVMGSENRKQLLADILRNARGAPESLLSLGSGLVDMAGTGLGTLAGMAGSKLRGEKVDMDAAAEGMQAGKFTYTPRTEGGQGFARGLGTVLEPLEHGMQWAGQKTTDVTGSPALGAAVYTGLNVLDPQMLAPAAAKAAALRGAARTARSVTSDPVKPKGSPYSRQEGAWSPADLAGVEGNYELKSPSLSAFDRLKPQEQGRVTGKQLRAALMREGAKKEELAWMGLDDILNSGDLIETADVRRLAEANRPDIQAHATRANKVDIDDDVISERAREAAYDSSDLEYPYEVTRDGEVVGTFDNEHAARLALREMKDELRASEVEYYLENIAEHVDAEDLATMDDAARQEWAEQMADNAIDEIDFDYSRNYDAEPTNLDELVEHYEEEIRQDPAGWGLSGTSSPPAYGQYTVGGEGRNTKANYTVASVNLAGDARYGRGTRADPPGFIEPYLQDTATASAAGQLPLLPEAPRSKAFEIEALRRQRLNDDPNRSVYQKISGESHYGELGPNQMTFVRETDRPAPSWGSVQEGVGRQPDASLATPEQGMLPDSVERSYPLRLVEEVQSDWYQKGRKSGWADEKGLEKANALDAQQFEAHRAAATAKLDEAVQMLEDPEVAALIARVRANAAVNPNGSGGYEQALRNQLDQLDQLLANPDAPLPDKLRTAASIADTIYYLTPAGSHAEGLSRVVRRGIQELPSTGRVAKNKLVASGPLRETPQYTKLALIDALRRAVQEGQQYVAFTPGDVHARRWGTDTIQYAVDPKEPRTVRYNASEGYRSHADMPQLEALQSEADQLIGNQWASQLDLDSPDAGKQLRDVVNNQLHYGMGDYPYPEIQKGKRAELIQQQMEALARKAAESGEGQASHYSPRAVGYEAAYGPIEQMFADILRAAGSKAEIKPIMDYNNERLLGFEIDPELARAVKRGLPLPY